VYLELSIEGYSCEVVEKGGDKIWIMTKIPEKVQSLEEVEDIEEDRDLVNIFVKNRNSR
jgi:hypothetical protein